MPDNRKKQPEVEILSEDVLWDGFIKLRNVTANIPTASGDTIKISREVHDHGNAVTVLPFDKQREKALLVGQWRIPAWQNGHKKRIWEAPAGLIDAGETPEQAAIREALEETGYEIKNLKKICSPFASPGLVTEKVDIFLAEYSETSRKSETIGLAEEGEDIELKEFNFNELFRLLDSGELYDAVTVIAVYALREAIRNN